MDSIDTDVKDNNDNSQIQPTTTPPPSTNNPSRSSSPSCTTLLVIDDNSHSEEEEVVTPEPILPITNDIPPKPTPPITAQISDIPVPTLLPPFTLDISNGTADQQRRRNSSIAKLLGGHPLNNHQYEEITQQILEDQSAQNVMYNNDSGIDAGNQRPRSSITRTLLMNSERTNSFSKLPSKPPTASSSSSATARDFEYLIRQEPDKPDNDYSLQRHNSAPKMFQNLNSSSNSNAQSPTQTKLKRKRPIVPPPVPTSNIPPFSLHEPFELEPSAINSTSSIHPSRSQNDLVHFDSSKRIRHSNSQQFNNLPVNNFSTNESSYPYSKHNMNSTMYNQFNIHQDSVQSNNSSSPFNSPRYSHSTKLSLPTPIPQPSSISSRSNSSSNITTSVACKAKSMFAQNDEHVSPRPRSYSNTFNQSDSSSEPNVPLKKRLLHAYNNEQHPTTPL